MGHDNHISDERISRYMDDEIFSSAKAAIEKHLEECELCRNRLNQFNVLHRVVQQSPEPVMERDRWASIDREIRRPDHTNTFFGKYKRWAAAAAVALIALIGGWMLLSHQYNIDFSGPEVVASVNPFSFDFGLYLTGLNDPAQMKRFTEGYNREEVNLDRALAELNIENTPDRFQELMKNLPPKTVYLLNSACCKSMQVTVQHEGKEFTIFKQPREHPVEFTGYRMKHTRIGSTECTRVEAGPYVALTFTTDFAKYVVVGEQNDPMLATVTQKLSAQN